jgi:transposase-like protein
MPTDKVVFKSVFVAVMGTTKKWTKHIREWGMILNQFLNSFENRLKL